MVTSVSGPQVDPAPLFDLVTGFPPDDAVDLTVPLPLSLAVHMTMLESTGRASELAVIRKLHLEQARETLRSVQAMVGRLAGVDAGDGARLRITHIIEERVPAINGLRPHVHAYVGPAVRSPGGGTPARVDVEELAALAGSSLLAEHHDRVAAVTAEGLGLVWGETPWSGCEIVEPRWLVERTEAARHDDVSCAGPWPRRQIIAGRRDEDGRPG